MKFSNSTPSQLILEGIENSAYLYMFCRCAQIEITGGGSLQPTAAELVTFPGAYTNNGM